MNKATKSFLVFFSIFMIGGFLSVLMSGIDLGCGRGLYDRVPPKYCDILKWGTIILIVILILGMVGSGIAMYMTKDEEQN